MLGMLYLNKEGCFDMKKFIRICEYILFFLFAILLLFFTNKISTLIIIPLFIVLLFIVRKMKIKNYAIFIFILALIIRLISVFYLKVNIVDDFKTMYEASRDLIVHNLEFLKSSYFKIFSYQLGHVLYQGALLKIINSVLFLKIVNSLVTSFIVLFIYLISKKLFSEKTARCVSLLYLFFLYPIYLNSVLTNQHIPALLGLITIYLLITKKNSYKLSVIIGIILAVANVLRTESIIIILSIIIYNLFLEDLIAKKKIINSIILVLSYTLVLIAFNGLILISPLHTSLKNNASEWKFYCGLNYEHNGIYNEDDDKIYFSSNNKKELLKTRIKEENVKLPVLFLKKEVILWTQTNYDIQLLNNINSNLYNFILLFNQAFLNFIMILFIISLFPERKKTNKELLLLKVIIGIYYCVYMFIEISPRYAYILHILVFLTIGLGIERIKNLKKPTTR